ncbi:hypothetical protein PHSC3_001814 [Chlamydiales bacterium STE3]|nr:hypothetical protein PHSC3_001814 [Chlamydiales bacterium STE3]
MKPVFLTYQIDRLQDKHYEKLNKFSVAHPLVGRVVAFSIVLSDVGLNALKHVACLIESVALVPFNLIGGAFYPKYSLKDSIFCLEVSASIAFSLPVRFLLVPVKLISQIFAAVIHPDRVQSIRNDHLTF